MNIWYSPVDGGVGTVGRAAGVGDGVGDTVGRAVGIGVGDGTGESWGDAASSLDAAHDVQPEQSQL